MPATIELMENASLQELANRKDGVADVADESIELEVEDCFDSVGDQVSGVIMGLELAERVSEARRDDKDAQIYKITYSNYGDDDGVAFFVGSLESVRERLESLEDSEDYEEEEEEE